MQSPRRPHLRARWVWLWFPSGYPSVSLMVGWLAGWLVGWLVAQHLLDALHHTRRELLDQVKRFHVFVYLLDTASAGDHRADVGILQAPGDRHLRQRAAQLGGDRRESPDPLDVFRRADILPEPIEAFQRRTRSRRDAIVVLAGEQAGGQRAESRRAQADLCVQSRVFFFDAFA